MRCQAAQLSLVLRRRRPLPVGRLSLSLCLAFGGGGMAPPESPPAMDLVPFDDVRSTAPTNVPWAEMFRSASARRPPPPAPNPPPPPPPPPPKPERSQQELQRLALYVAMAHAGLAFCVLLFYGLYRLLQDFIRPIQWAVLCSIPLREIQTALVSFWAEPLASGPATTLLAVPAAAFRLSAATVLDLRSLFLRRRRPRIHKRRFRQLLRWLASFAVFVLAYERLGATAILLFSSVLLVADPAAAAFHDTSFSYRRRPAARRLETLVAAGLIAGMLGGAALGGSFFSYKIAMESKDAVVAVKAHVRSSNYAERIGFRRWMEENDISGKVDMYTAMAYGAALDQVDGLAAQYNLTDLAAELKHLIMLYGPVTSDAPAAALVASGRLPITEKLRSITAQVKNREWGGIYEEMSLVVEELQRSRADLVGKAKRVAQNIVAGSKTVVGGGAGVILSLGLAVVSGAGEVLNFVSQATVFVWVLYYLITAESGGVTEQVVAMLPASDAVRARCVEVIDKAISNVLLATAKIAIFQGCLTWLLFRLCSVHFLYVSTVLAAASPLMPFLPTWLSTVPAAAQLAVEKKYVGAAVLSLAHLTLMGLGVSAIQQDIPGYNEYLTGLSIIGGMALFPSAFEGAIMGPLIMTVVIAVKNLYVEFVLGDQAAGEQPSSSSSAP